MLGERVKQLEICDHQKIGIKETSSMVLPPAPNPMYIPFRLSHVCKLLLYPSLNDSALYTLVM
jgi:hypothetical protein